MKSIKPSLTRTGSLYRWTLDAPRGFVWRSGGVHELVAEGRGPNSREGQKDILERAAFGLQPCTDPDCDWCHESS